MQHNGIVHSSSLRLDLRLSGLLHGLEHGVAELSGTSGNMHTGSLQRGELIRGTALSTGDDGTGVAHSPSGRSRHAGNETNNRLVGVAVLLQPLRGILLGRTTDFADHDDTLRLRVVGETLQTIDEIRSIKGISSNADASGLSKSGDGGLMDGLVREGSRSADHANLSGGVNVARHNADLALPGLDDAGTVWSDETSGTLHTQGLLHLGHVLLGDALGDGHDERNFVLDGIHDGGGAERRGDVDDGRIGLDAVDGLGDGVEDGQAEVGLAALLGGNASDHVGAVLDGLGGVEGPLLAGESLANHLGVFVHPYIGSGGHAPAAGGGGTGGGFAAGSFQHRCQYLPTGGFIES
mmetsp:Transcript_22665/g.65266  ORF Transcript_22665/g.65266 Transcript_22665/m.65266 type:complete len:351 (-) Transcript_22665:195-1247(-)